MRCYVLEPESAPWLAGREITNPNHKIQGGGYSRDLPFISPELVEGYLTMSDEGAAEGARALARHEGIFAGFSSGANLQAAVSLLKGREKGNAIVFLTCDSGLKYLSTDLPWKA